MRHPVAAVYVESRFRADVIGRAQQHVLARECKKIESGQQIALPRRTPGKEAWHSSGLEMRRRGVKQRGQNSIDVPADR